MNPKTEMKNRQLRDPSHGRNVLSRNALLILNFDLRILN
jgi:hypothetical protein